MQKGRLSTRQALLNSFLKGKELNYKPRIVFEKLSYIDLAFLRIDRYRNLSCGAVNFPMIYSLAFV